MTLLIGVAATGLAVLIYMAGWLHASHAHHKQVRRALARRLESHRPNRTYTTANFYTDQNRTS